jgi:hypothetical protein
MLSSGMLRSVALVKTDVSEERNATGDKHVRAMNMSSSKLVTARSHTA